MRRWRAVLVALAVLVAISPAHAAGSALDDATVRALEASPYVYMATERKDGGFGAPAEIWFMWDGGAVWVASPPTAWRARRIRAGRPRARIAVGSRTGPSFTAKGSFVRDPAAYARLFATFAKKYPDGWPRYEAKFRSGLEDGSRVLMRYDPVPEPRPSPSPSSTP